MTSDLVQSRAAQTLLDKVSGVLQEGGDLRVKQIVRRIVSDLYTVIDEFDVSPDEFWLTLGFLQNGAPEFGLIAPGLGFDHFLDMRMDEQDRRRGIETGTPRTIEGPLYVPGAPLAQGFARLDDGSDTGEVLVMHGCVRDAAGRPVADAVVDVWHANTLGNYSHFDTSQTPYNNRRRIRSGADGRYKFQSIVPSGYAVPPQGTTERLLGRIGRHGQRPAHIHFFVSAPGCRLLTTQINIDGDPYLHDDFALATRDGLIPAIVRHDDPESMQAEGLNTPYSEIEFDFTLTASIDPGDTGLHARPRVPALESAAA